MTTAAEKTRQDVRAKYKLERKLSKKLNTLNRQIVREFRKNYAESGVILNAQNYRDDLDVMLQKHYQEVGDQFSDILSKELPDDVSITEEEENIIAEALGIYYLTRADDQSKLISETNQQEITQSVEEGITAANEADEPFTRVAAAIFASTLLLRKFNARRETVVITETQNVAEAAKITEAEVLGGLTPSINSRDRKETKNTKEWVSVGDERVRQTHVAADGQVVPVNEVYIVGGFSMMFPGDTNWGAPLSEVVNCRCSSQYDTVEIINFRRQRGQSDDS